MTQIGCFALGYGAARGARKFWQVFLSILLLWTVMAQADPIRIVALGDSLVHGYGLPPEQGFVPQMQAWLAQQGLQVDLVNAGVSGDTTTGARQRLDWALDDSADALIVSLGGNDILRAIDPSIARENLTAIVQTAVDRGLPVLLIGITVPPNYGPDYQRDFAAIYPDLAAQFGTLYYPDFLGALTGQEDRAATLARYFQPDGLHPNADGVALIVADMGPMVAELARLAAKRAGG